MSDQTRRLRRTATDPVRCRHRVRVRLFAVQLHPHPVLGDRGERDEPVGEVGRDALGEEGIEDVGMLDAERGEGVVVQPDPAT